MEWTGNFSSDADAGAYTLRDADDGRWLANGGRGALGVIQDAKFKRREALADLAKAATKKQ